MALMLTRNSADARNCVQALIKYLQNLWLFLSAFNLTGTTTRLSFDETVTRVQHYYAFHEEASLKVQGIKGSTSQTQGPDVTLSTTTLNSAKITILEGLTRLRTKVMELNPNFIQSLDVESLLTLFVENFFSKGLTRTPPWCSTFACVFPDVLTNY